MEFVQFLVGSVLTVAGANLYFRPENKALRGERLTFMQKICPMVVALVIGTVGLASMAYAFIPPTM